MSRLRGTAPLPRGPDRSRCPPSGRRVHPRPPVRPRALRRERARRGDRRDGTVRPRDGPRRPRRFVRGAAAHLRGPAEAGPFAGGPRRDLIPIAAPRPARPLAPPGRRIPDPRSGEGVLPAAARRGRATGGPWPGGGVLALPIRRIGGGLPAGRPGRVGNGGGPPDGRLAPGPGDGRARGAAA